MKNTANNILKYIDVTKHEQDQKIEKIKSNIDELDHSTWDMSKKSEDFFFTTIVVVYILAIAFGVVIWKIV